MEQVEISRVDQPGRPAQERGASPDKPAPKEAPQPDGPVQKKGPGTDEPVSKKVGQFDGQAQAGWAKSMDRSKRKVPEVKNDGSFRNDEP